MIVIRRQNAVFGLIVPFAMAFWAVMAVETLQLISPLQRGSL